MAALTYSQLVASLRQNKSCTAVTITSETIPKMRKTNNPYFGMVRKVSRVNGLIGWEYENAVNNQREREGHGEVFFSEPRAWGMKIGGTPLVQHNGEFYLELKVQKVLFTEYQHIEGHAVAPENLKPFLPERSGESSRQETEKEIVLRDYKVSSLRQITYRGQNIDVVPEPVNLDALDAEGIKEFSLEGYSSAARSHIRTYLNIRKLQFGENPNNEFIQRELNKLYDRIPIHARWK